MATVDYAQWRFALDVFNVALTICVGIYVWLSNRDKVTNQRIGKLEKTFDDRMDKYSERLARVEAVCNHQPGHGDLSKVYDRMNGLAAEAAETRAGVADLQGEMRAVRRSLDLINQHLINQG